MLRYLRDREPWGIEDRLTLAEGEELVIGIVNALRGHILSVEKDSSGEDRGV